MPEYLAPGVYVEETSFRAKSIEGVSTSTTGFVGPTRFGPTEGVPEVLTSFADFERIYGGLEDLDFGSKSVNYLAHAARAYFEEGGRRLYVARVHDGATKSMWPKEPDPKLKVQGRYAGVAGNVEVAFELQVGGNVLSDKKKLIKVRNHDSVVVISGTPAVVHVCEAQLDPGGKGLLAPIDGGPSFDVENVDKVYLLTVKVDVARPTLDSRGLLTFGPKQTLGSFVLSWTAPDGVFKVLGEPTSLAPASVPPIVLTLTPDPKTDLVAIGTFLTALFEAEKVELPDAAAVSASTDPLPPKLPQAKTVVLRNGKDGSQPKAAAYTGKDDVKSPSGLLALAAIEDISIVAAPGSSAYGDTLPSAIRNAVIAHCDLLRYRVAVLDTPSGKTVGGAKDYRNQMSSTRAAIYYPWVQVTNPFDGTPLLLPPSGFVAGIWARNDVEHAVFKSPANEVLRSAVDLEVRLSKSQQEVLNPEGVNCLRFFPGRGNLVWGARTMSDDPEWKYVSVRRYFAYLEHSVERGTQWAVFESNGEALWANVRRTIEDFLLNEWKMGALLGADAKEAFFVRCDRSTMTQNDLDNGRLVCLIGVAVVKPAEFVIFRIGQWTATARN